ncbi:hypothetical protein [Methylobacterium tarhaniae]|uniref:hypothetical protein n=1 Tax=Methylobacterium tarhaniae TaxID=1187852 RepID=UPI00069F8A4B
MPGDYDAALIIADGLSATAVDRHALPLPAACRELLERGSFGPIRASLLVWRERHSCTVVGLTP